MFYIRPMKYYSIIVTAICIILIVLMRSCYHFGNCPDTPNQPIGKTTIKDSISRDTTKYGIPYPVLNTVTTIEHDSVPKNLTKKDTIDILRKYFGTQAYKRIFDDKDLKLTAFDTIDHDSLLGGSITYQILRADTIKTITTTIPQNKFKLWIGGNIGGNLTTFSTLEPFIGIATKKDAFYDLGYNFLDHTLIVGMGWKVSFSKK